MRESKFKIKKLAVLALLAVFGLGSFMATGSTYAATEQRIIFSSNRDGSPDLYTMRTDGSGVSRLTNSSDQAEIYASWSPGGAKISYGKATVNSGPNLHLYIMNADGTGEQQVSSGDNFLYTYFWSPDGSKIAYTEAQDLGTQNPSFSLSVFDVQTSQTITVEPPVEFNPGGLIPIASWSPDSSKVIYASVDYGNMGELVSFSLADSQKTQITNTTAQYHFPVYGSWSLDSSRFFYINNSFSDDVAELKAMDSNGANQQVVTDLWVEDGSQGGGQPFVWSPDGSKIAYTTLLDESNVYTIDSSSLQISKRSNFAETPADGSYHGYETWINNEQLVVSVSGAGQSDTQIYLVNTNGQPEVNLSNNEYADLVYYNAVNVVPLQGGENPNPEIPGGITPTAPKTGKLVGVVMLSISLLALLVLMAKEVNFSKNQKKASSK